MRRPNFKSRMWRVAFLLAGVCAVWLTYQAYASPPRGPVGEMISPDEAAYASQIIDSGITMLLATREQQRDGLYRRDAHAKTHGCLLADFKVRNNAGTPFQQGLFAKEQSYKAWIRFSSGSTSLLSDWQLLGDAHGMATKVLGVPGRKLLEGEEQARTQDFVMIDNPVFFIRDVEEYASLTRYQAQGSQFGYFFQSSLNPLNWKLREFRIGFGLLKLPRDLLGNQFHSMTAYKLGASNFVKYSAKPVPCDSKGSVPDGWASFDHDGLRKDLEQQMGRGPECFDFMAQLQVVEKDKYMPVEDTTVLWQEKDSPFVTIARIEIPKAAIAENRENEFCENLSFTPWHSLPEHEPAGGLNRIRKAVYQGISRYRRCLNHIGFGEPKDDGSRQFEMMGKDACDPFKPVPTLTSSGSQ